MSHFLRRHDPDQVPGFRLVISVFSARAMRRTDTPGDVD